MARSVRPLAVPLAVPLAAAAALALSACGQGGSDSVPDRFTGAQRDVAQTVEDLQSAGRKRDADEICKNLLASDLVRQIERASKGTCPDVLGDALDDADAFDLETQQVAVRGTTATARVRSEAGDDDRTDTLLLRKVGAGWRVAALDAARVETPTQP